MLYFAVFYFGPPPVENHTNAIVLFWGATWGKIALNVCLPPPRSSNMENMGTQLNPPLNYSRDMQLSCNIINKY
jgi:hypothetical protein